MVNPPLWSWYDVSAGASRGSSQIGGEAEAGGETEARGPRMKPDSPDSGGTDTPQGPDVETGRSIWKFQNDLKLRTFESSVCFTVLTGKKCAWKHMI